MIAANDLRSIARARLRDAEVLLRARRFDGAFYLCGYAVEVALNARICRTLKWPAFPEAGHDFKGLQSLKTHDLEIDEAIIFRAKKAGRDRNGRPIKALPSAAASSGRGRG